MRKKSFKLAAYLLTLALVMQLLMPVVGWAEENQSSSVDRIAEILNILKENHVSGVDENQLTNDAIEGMIKGLNDPYTQYFSPVEWSRFLSQLQQEFVGIGIVLFDNKGKFVIQEVIANAPAEKAGIQAEDTIISVNGVSLAGKKINDVTSLILGKEGTDVKLKILRGSKETKDFTITRAKIKIPVVQSKLLKDQVGYIKLTSFSDDGDELFIQAKQQLEAGGMKSLVIDLRGNGGGLLDTAFNIANQFIEEGTLMRTLNRNNVEQSIEIHNGSKVNYPVLILVDQNSASASEVLSGALQDYGVAKLVGTKTFGKGSVQQSVPLKTGGVLKITIEHYVTPKGRVVNHVGLTPDFEAKGNIEALAYALSLLGKSIELKTTEKESIINGFTFKGKSPYLHEERKVWIPARLAAAVAGMSLQWDAKTKTIRLIPNQGDLRKTLTYSPKNYKLVNGTSYLDLSLFAKQVLGLKFEDSVSQTLLTFTR